MKNLPSALCKLLQQLISPLRWNHIPYFWGRAHSKFLLQIQVLLNYIYTSLSLFSTEELQLLETLAVRHIFQSLLIQWTLTWNCLTCMCEARTLLNWDQLQTLSIASRVPRFIHTRIPFVEANISSCWVICPGLPADSLLLKALLTCEDDLKDLSSNEFYFWLHLSLYKKICCLCAVFQACHIASTQGPDFFLIDCLSLHVNLGVSMLTELSRDFT